MKSSNSSNSAPKVIVPNNVSSSQFPVSDEFDEYKNNNDESSEQRILSRMNAEAHNNTGFDTSQPPSEKSYISGSLINKYNINNMVLDSNVIVAALVNKIYKENSNIDFKQLEEKIMNILKNDLNFNDIGIRFTIEECKTRKIPLNKRKSKKICEFPNMFHYEPYPYFKQHKITVLTPNQLMNINRAQIEIARMYGPIFRKLFLEKIEESFKYYTNKDVQSNIWITKLHYEKENHRDCVAFEEEKIIQIINNKKLIFNKENYFDTKFENLSIRYNGEIVNYTCKSGARRTVVGNQRPSALSDDLDSEENKNQGRASFNRESNPVLSITNPTDSRIFPKNMKQYQAYICEGSKVLNFPFCEDDLKHIVYEGKSEEKYENFNEVIHDFLFNMIQEKVVIKIDSIKSHHDIIEEKLKEWTNDINLNEVIHKIKLKDCDKVFENFKKSEQFFWGELITKFPGWIHSKSAWSLIYFGMLFLVYSANNKDFTCLEYLFPPYTDMNKYDKVLQKVTVDFRSTELNYIKRKLVIPYDQNLDNLFFASLMSYALMFEKIHELKCLKISTKVIIFNSEDEVDSFLECFIAGTQIFERCKYELLNFSEVKNRIAELKNKYCLVVDSLIFKENSPRCLSALRPAYLITF